MSFTTLKVNERGILLFALHEERFKKAGLDAVKAYRQFAAKAEPGIYTLYWDNTSLQVNARGESRLFDGMPVRYRVSPIPNSNNRIDKPSHPSIYTDLIKPGISTLLTSLDGKELFESCSASIIAWNGKNIVKVPADRPAVRSTMEGLLKELTNIIEEPILRESDYPLALINAVKCTCTINFEGRKPFPAEQLQIIKELYYSTACRE